MKKLLLLLVFIAVNACKEEKPKPMISEVADSSNRTEKLKLPEHTELLTFVTEDPSKYLDEIIANANGAVIYIDHWATWCGPCKAEFKEGTPALKAQFDGQVEFVYLCYQSKKALWEPNIAKFKVTGNHYFIERGEEEALFDQLSLEGFPTYTLINKKGEIVESGFDYRPSNPDTAELLTGLLKENP